MKELHAPSKNLMQQVRAGFITQGTTFTDWCRRHQIRHTSARQAIYGSWDGPKAKTLRARIVRAAGIGAAA